MSQKDIYNLNIYILHIYINHRYTKLHQMTGTIFSGKYADILHEKK